VDVRTAAVPGDAPAEPYAELPKARLGISLLVAALHTPVQLAKALATIDQISGGRVIAGLGTGWSTDEFRATGATRADHGRFLDETLDGFDAVWGPDPVTFRSPRVVIDNAWVLPKPVSKIPVMLGGVTPKAVQTVRQDSTERRSSAPSAKSSKMSTPPHRPAQTRSSLI
jgi:alkanesulfonate monooxygenase SsuD/methylene tetrahydromethanopterin reductase-like flavin-dependent oxidoreductase (luciferase family)